MQIVLSDRARNHLLTLPLENKCIRLRVIETNSCNAAIEFDLMIDEQQAGDEIKQVDSFTFIYNEQALEDIGSYVKIDYVPSQGLKMTNKNQILSYGLRLHV